MSAPLKPHAVPKLAVAFDAYRDHPRALLATAAGSVLRLDGRTLEIVLAPEVTAGLAPGGVVLDLVRTDLTPDRHLGFVLEIPVALPVTRLPVSAGL